MVARAFTAALSVLAAYLMATGVYRLAWATAPAALRTRRYAADDDDSAVLAHACRALLGALLLVVGVGVHVVTGGR